VGGKRFVWNAQNRVLRPLAVIDTTDSWTYSTSTFRAMNNTAANKCEFVQGLPGESAQAMVVLRVFPGAGGNAGCGIGVDSASVNSAKLSSDLYNNQAAAGTSALYDAFAGIGYHYFQPLEYSGSGTATYYGDGGQSDLQSGLMAKVLA
jgi:hypothetical protein